MKLLVQTQIEFKPMLLGRPSKAFLGEDLMPKLRYCPAPREELDVIPFPGTANRSWHWQPRLADDHLPHEAEAALDQVNDRLARLADLFNLDDNDRPRAA